MNIDPDKTEAFYKSDRSEPCDCAYCRNYCRRIKAARPDLAEHLAGMGIDIEKPFELFYTENEIDKTVTYHCCMYIVFGTCEKDLSYHFDGAWFTNNTEHHPDTGITEDHFVLDLGEITLDMEDM